MILLESDVGVLGLNLEKRDDSVVVVVVGGSVGRGLLKGSLNLVLPRGVVVAEVSAAAAALGNLDPDLNLDLDLEVCSSGTDGACLLKFLEASELLTELLSFSSRLSERTSLAEQGLDPFSGLFSPCSYVLREYYVGASVLHPGPFNDRLSLG